MEHNNLSSQLMTLQVQQDHEKIEMLAQIRNLEVNINLDHSNRVDATISICFSVNQ